MSVDLEKLAKQVDEALAKETPESLTKWLNERRQNAETGEKQCNLPIVTNRTLKDSRKQAYLQGYSKRAIMSNLTYDHTSEINAVKEFENWHLNLYGW